MELHLAAVESSILQALAYIVHLGAQNRIWPFKLERRKHVHQCSSLREGLAGLRIDAKNLYHKVI